MAIHIKDTADLESKLTDAGDNLVVIDFHATWCGPCRLIAPKLEELASSNPDIVVLKVDVDECEELAMQYDIKVMPTFIFIKKGVKVDAFSGGNYDKLQEVIMKHK
uniref:Thioredoxin n=1 Tax=Triatoma dimidiata TaxID=72491 RepID=A0A0V0G3P6_TRIDM